MARAASRQKEQLYGFIDVRCLFAQMKLRYQCNFRLPWPQQSRLCIYSSRAAGAKPQRDQLSIYPVSSVHTLKHFK